MKVNRSLSNVVVLYNMTEHLAKGQPLDMLAERAVIACAQAVSATLEAVGYRVAQVPVHTDLERELAPYPPNDWVVFNLGEGLEGRLFEEARIAWALEAMGYRFTGAGGDAIALSVHKARAKFFLNASGIATPTWWVFKHPDEVDRAAIEDLSFPLIVKPIAEDASLGVGPDAVVSSIRTLKERVAYVAECYRQAALAEAFIVGREFSVALWSDPPEVLPISEIDFSAFTDPYTRIVSFAAKWDESSFDYCHMPVLCPAPVEHSLRDHLEVTASRAWAAIGCRNYARVDLRLSDEGILYVMEVNCNPDLSPDAGFYRSARVAGYSYQAMVVHILDLALRQPSAYDRESCAYRWPVRLGTDGRHQRLQPNGSKLRRRAMERVSG